jgi:carboxyl-terminal processing protease
MIFKKILPLLILSSFFLVFAGDSLAQTRRKRVVKTSASNPPNKFTIVGSPAAAFRTPEQQRRYDSFLKVWLTIRDNYFDQTFNGLDWQKIRSEFEPRVAKTTTDIQLHDLLQEMIDRLNKSHFSIVPPEIYQAIEFAKITARAKERQRLAEKGDGTEDENAAADDDSLYPEDIDARYGIGIEMRLMNNQFVITRVNENSTAGKAGLRTGFVIEKINGVSLQDLLKKIDQKYAKTKGVTKLLASEIVRWILNGEKDTEVGLTYLNEKDEIRELKVPREKLGDEKVSIGRNYPELYLNFETRSINDDTGYVRFNIFAMPIVEKFCSALTQFKDKKSLIIDLRGNHGGLFAALIGITGMLSDRTVDLGTQIFKVGSEKITSSSMVKNFRGRIVFLVDEVSISSAEVLAAAMQESGRALLVGEKTAGEALPAYSLKLATGAVFVYPVANFKTANGKFIEGVGVTPDIPILIDRKALLEGRDPQMEAALKTLKDDAAFSKLTPTPHPATRFTIKGNPPPPPKPKATPDTRPPASAADNVISAPSASSKDEKSLALIADFVKQVGGAEAIARVNSYSLKGTAEIRMQGMETDAEIEIYRDGPDRYAEFLKTDSIGEIREIFNKDSYVMQTGFGLISEMQVGPMSERRDFLFPIVSVADMNSFKTLEYEGIFDRSGRKAHLVNATGRLGETIALAFDVETKMLVAYAGAGRAYSMGDYQKVQDLMLPFSMEKDGIDITVSEIKLNIPIEEGNFKKKINCFDRPN